MHALLVESD
uniref:Uncharacterized protein n=1 Tax=Arundo donax TaxID=35708 RepID=A0A0A8YC10_ARUDO